MRFRLFFINFVAIKINHTMKTFSFFTFALWTMMLCLAACSSGDEEPTVEPTVPTETITIDTKLMTSGLQFSTEQGELSVTFTTTENWTLSMDEESRSVSWCRASAESGEKGTATVTFTVDENQFLEIRLASVTIKAGNETKTFRIFQKGTKENAAILSSSIFFREKIACLANGKDQPGNILHESQITPDSLIERIVVECNKDKQPQGKFITISPQQSSHPIYAIWDKNKKQITLQTKAQIIYLEKEACDMFNGLKKLSYCDFSKFNTLYVENMNCMFKNAFDKTAIDLSKLNTSNVTSMASMFWGCRATSLNLTGFDTSNVAEMRSIFGGCENLTSLDLSNFDTSNITSMNGMFSGCLSLTSLNISSFDTSNVTDMSYMFSGCEKLATLDVSHFNTGKVENMVGMFQVCQSLTALNLSNFDTSKVKDMSWMFNFCKQLTNLNISNFNTAKVENMSYMFHRCFNLSTLDIKSFDTSNVKDMTTMFSSCQQLTSLDVSHFNTSKVTNMSWMFSDCSNLTSLNISSFDTSSVTDMQVMFNSCRKLKTLDLTSFSFTKKPKVSYMLADIGQFEMPSSIIVTKDGYNYLTQTTNDCNINVTAKFVKPDGSDW